ncbi:hypothetical protein ASF43_24215 [Pseudorhodoferax sp. Leaf267]|nr:hypothetical protein ASF43_24215 [Pseudorhodoferax sp. Leaf267]
MNPAECFDVAVLGRGPAAMAAAISLRRAAHRVLVLAPARPAPTPPGDSLAPDAKHLLRRLGVWQAFEADGHLACHGNRSAWATSTPRHFDFIHHPQGHGFHIDRAVFDRRLVERARALGADIDSFDAPPAIVPDAAGWQGQHGPRRWQARWVVDASGQASWFARHQGVARLQDDAQVALVATLQAPGLPADTASLIEAVPRGWWYCAPLPQGRWSAMFFTDADLHDHRALRTAAGWQALLAGAPLTWTRLQQHGAVLAGAPAFTPAASARLARFAGPGWLAVGDAAMRYDPLSAHGLTVALHSGIEAGQALSASLAGDGTAVQRYADALDHAHALYARMRLGLYREAVRFAGQPYWQRRQREAVASS